MSYSELAKKAVLEETKKELLAEDRSQLGLNEVDWIANEESADVPNEGCEEWFFEEVRIPKSGANLHDVWLVGTHLDRANEYRIWFVGKERKEGCLERPKQNYPGTTGTKSADWSGGDQSLTSPPPNSRTLPF